MNRIFSVILFVFFPFFTFIDSQELEKNIEGDFKRFIKENFIQKVSKGEIWAIPAINSQNPFLIGWELSVSVVSGENLLMDEGYIISFYSNSRPYPHEDIKTYRVRDRGAKSMGAPYSFNFKILKRDWAPKGQWQVISADLDEYPILFMLDSPFQSAYKLESQVDSIFNVKISPIYNEQGIISFELFDKKTKEPIKSANIFLDGKNYSWPFAETVLRDKGIYSLQIKSAHYEDQSMQIQVEPGRENLFQIALEKARTKVFFSASDITTIIFDKRPISDIEKKEGIYVDSGIHVVTLTLGSYRISRSFFMEEGTKYQINFNLSLDMKEVATFP